MAVASKKRKIFDDRYEILTIIGRGSQSVVYQARNVIEGGPEVALKVLVNKKGGVPNSERLRKEALAMVSCNHRYVVRLDDFHTIGDVSYLSMELAPGGDIRKYMEQHGDLPPKTIEKFFIQTAEALDYIHKVGIIHRDVKPDNILVLNENEVRLGDFGIALLPGENPATEEAQMGVGTLDYLSPEILEGKSFNILSDLYSLGICFYEILSGKSPFADVPLVQQLDARRNGHVKELKTVRPDIPAHFSDIIHAMLRYNPAERFQNAGELLKALKQAQAGTPVTVVPAAAEPKAKEPAVQERVVEVIPLQPQAAEQAAPASSAPDPVQAAPVAPRPALSTTTEEPNVEESGLEQLDEIEEDPYFDDTEDEPIEETPAADNDADEYIEQPSPSSSRRIQPAPQMFRGGVPDKNGTANSNRSAPQQNTFFTTILIACIVAIIVGAAVIRRSTETAAASQDEAALQEAGIVPSESFDGAIIGDSFDFTRLQPGVYSGMIGGVVPGRQVPFSIIALEQKRTATVLVGIDGWTPPTIPLDSESIMQEPNTLRVASNGFVLVLRATGDLKSSAIKGRVSNMVTGESASWVLAPEQ